jgi:uncharacterized membrane protein YdbT with pleckstrin-like domain
MLAAAMDLQSGENVIYQGHPSWRAILGFYLTGVIVGAIAGIAVGLIESTGTGVLVAAAVIAVTVVAGLVKRIATTYTITDRRLNIKRGIVSRKVQETRLQRVQNVNFSQSVYQRLMQIGDVDFDTAAGDDYNFVFAGVAEPEEVVQQVDVATHSDPGAGLADARPQG